MRNLSVIFYFISVLTTFSTPAFGAEWDLTNIYTSINSWNYHDFRSLYTQKDHDPKKGEHRVVNMIRYFGDFEHPFYTDIQTHGNFFEKEEYDDAINESASELAQLLENYLKGDTFADYRQFLQEIQNDVSPLNVRKSGLSLNEFILIEDCEFLPPVFFIDLYDLRMRHAAKCRSVYRAENKLHLGEIYIYRSMDVTFLLSAKDRPAILEFKGLKAKDWDIIPEDRPHLDSFIWIHVFVDESNWSTVL